MRLRSLAVCIVLMGAGPAPPEPAGYRVDDYRTPTPTTVAGRSALDTQAAERLWRSGAAVFVDTLPFPPKPSGLPAGTIWNPKPRDDIPGSIWLPDTGYGELAPMTEAYFRAGLTEATHGDTGKTLVFYCLANCWMSWNAAKRALALGYSNAAWFADGTDGWHAAGLPLERRLPVPRPGE